MCQNLKWQSGLSMSQFTDGFKSLLHIYRFHRNFKHSSYVVKLVVRELKHYSCMAKCRKCTNWKLTRLASYLEMVFEIYLMLGI